MSLHKKRLEELQLCSFFLIVLRLTVTLLFYFSSINASAQFKGDSIIDNWHKYAAKAELNNYFNLMHNKFIFLGTAPGERWSKDQFYTFSKPYFDDGKAWDFNPSNRKWNFSSDSTVAWFDEELDTWMRGCRGSGILVYDENQWKIIYYNLTVLIENEKIKSFIKLRDLKD